VLPGPGEKEPESSPGLAAEPPHELLADEKEPEPSQGLGDPPREPPNTQQSWRASAGWVVAALLGIYVVIDLVGDLTRGTDDNTVRGAQAPASSQGVVHRQVAEPGPASSSPVRETPLSEFIPNEETPEKGSDPSNDVPPSSGLAADTQAPALGGGSPQDTQAPAPGGRSPEASPASAAPAPSPARSAPKQLSGAAFRRSLAKQRAELDLCIFGSPPVVVRVSLAADGEVEGIDTGRASSLVSLCLRDVLTAIDFPRAGAASRHRLRLGGAP